MSDVAAGKAARVRDAGRLVSAATQVYYSSFDAVFLKLPAALRACVEAIIDEIGLWLKSYPHHRLKGSNRFRARVGEHRIIYTFDVRHSRFRPIRSAAQIPPGGLTNRDSIASRDFRPEEGASRMQRVHALALLLRERSPARALRWGIPSGIARSNRPPLNDQTDFSPARECQ